MSEWKNRLYYGDNLEILRKHIPDASVDLIYLDPLTQKHTSVTFTKAPKVKRKEGEQGRLN